MSENRVGSCGEGFWLWPRRRGRSIPAAGCDGRANAGHGQLPRLKDQADVVELMVRKALARDLQVDPTVRGFYQEIWDKLAAEK